MLPRKYLSLDRALAFVVLGSAITLNGCAEAPESGEDVAAEDEPIAPKTSEEPSSAVAQTPLVAGNSSRSDVVGTARLNEGLWGDWTQTRYCPEGSRAVGYRLRGEVPQGSGDDSALNAIELSCLDDLGRMYKASAHDGLYGSWSRDIAFCANGSVMVGGSIRFEGNQRSGDDSAANDVKVRCSDGNDIQANGGLTYGSWQSRSTCPTNSSVCGVKVRFEKGQGSGDDTALNAVEFACCTDTVKRTHFQFTESRDGFFRTRTFSPNSGPSQAPLVVLGGFHTDHEMGLNELENGLPSMMLDNMIRRGYSVTLVDAETTQNWSDLRTNARAFGEILNNIWAKSTQTRPIKVVGVSMGGLIAATTVAIRSRWSEVDEWNPRWTFQVDHLSTVDTPHGGAYVPQAIYNTMSRLSGKDVAAAVRRAALESQAAQQMLAIPLLSQFEAERNKWVNYYETVKLALRKTGIPVVGFVDGSWTGVPQYSNWTSGTFNLKWEYRSWAADFDVWANTQPAPLGHVATIKADFFAVGGDETTDYYATAGNWPLLENSPGGSLALWTTMADQLEAAQIGTINVSGPMFGNVSFVPSWSAAGLTLADYQRLTVAQQQSMATLERELGPVAHSRLSPLTKVVAVNNPFGENSVHATLDADDSLDEELFSAFDYTWSSWISRDTPTGNGDGEYRGLMNSVPCSKPFAAQCRRISDQLDSTLTGEVVRCDLDGAECINSKQTDLRCDDYEVRFACANPTNVAPYKRYWKNSL